MDLAAAIQGVAAATADFSGTVKHMDAAINKLAAASMSFHAATQDFRRMPNNFAVAA